MNCRRVEKLMPLYVGGDVRPGAANRIASHLLQCSRCDRLAEEYQDIQSWLRGVEGPLFDDALFHELKQGVLQQVASARPASMATGGPPWGRKYALALTVVLAIFLGAAAVIYVYQSRANVGPALVAGKVVPENEETTLSDPPSSAPKKAPVAASAGIRILRIKRHSKSPLIARDRLERPIVARTSTSTEQAAASSTEGSNRDHEPLRIEFQTSDPHIRIIWFAHAEPNSPQSKAETN